MRIPAAILGKWTPPAWLTVSVLCILKRPRAVLSTVLVVAGMGFGGWKWWLWHEAHKPRPRELVSVRRLSAKVTAPALALVRDSRAPAVTSLGVQFDDEAALIGWGRNLYQPVTIENVRVHLSISAAGGDGIFTRGSELELMASAQSPLTFHIRSPRIEIPKDEDFVKFAIRPGVVAIVGGAPMVDEALAKVTVPTRGSGFHISKVHASLVPSEDGEPRQLLFVETDAAADPKTIEKSLSVWPLPKREGDWTTPDVTPEVLANLKPLKLESVEEDDAPKFAKRFAFRLPPLAPCIAFLRFPAGVVSVGGFELSSEFSLQIAIPAFQKEAKIIGEGGVLALSGERKLSVKSRGYENLRFTLGRVPAGQINHLVSQTEGESQSPEFRAHFGKKTSSAFIARRSTSRNAATTKQATRRLIFPRNSRVPTRATPSRRAQPPFKMMKVFCQTAKWTAMGVVKADTTSDLKQQKQRYKTAIQ